MHCKEDVWSHRASRSKSIKRGSASTGKSTIGHRRHFGHTENIKSEHTPLYPNTVVQQPHSSYTIQLSLNPHPQWEWDGNNDKYEASRCIDRSRTGH